MAAVKNILSLVIRILFILTLMITTLISLYTAYVVFSPNNFPLKAVFLAREGSGGAETPQAHGTAVSGGGHPVTQPTSSHGGGEVPTPSFSVIPPGEGIMYDAGTKIANLNDGRLVRISVVLEYAPNNNHDLEKYIEYRKAKAAGSSSSGGGHGSETGATTVDFVTAFTETLKTKAPIIGDVLSSVISAHPSSDLLTTAGKDALKQELMKNLNTRLPEYRTIAVYFHDLVIE